MLQYNPYFRPNIEECLESEVFNSIRVNKIEKVQTSEIELDILNPHTFDYKTGVSLTYSIDQYKKLLLKEMKSFKKWPYTIEPQGKSCGYQDITGENLLYYIFS